MKGTKKKDKTTNWFDELPKEFKKVQANPDYDNHLLNIPFRCLIVGGSGSGKTSTLYEFLSRAPKTFKKVILVCKSADEPLYRYLQETNDPEYFVVYDLSAGQKVPRLDEIEDDHKGENKLIVFDDLITLSKRELVPVCDWFIRSRKFNYSCFFLTQCYFTTPKAIRLNSNVKILKKIESTNDMTLILRENSLGLTRDQLWTLYNYCTGNGDKGDFLLIDLDKDEHHGKFRQNFLNIISIQ